MSTAPIIPVILCGGSGTRLWPLSRRDTPKQFLKLGGDTSFFQETVRRALEVTGASAGDVVCVTLASMARKAGAQLSAIHPDLTKHIVAEPEARNTAAAIALAALYVRRHFGDEALMLILPSDHHVTNTGHLKAALMAAVPAASAGRPVTFGITPTRPETGYGYIRAGAHTPYAGVLHVEEFTEKPEQHVAQRYTQSGAYLWNSGMALLSASGAIDQFSIHAPETLRLAESAFDGAPNFYKSIPKVSFDTAILEKAKNVVVVPCDIGWSDIGSWHGLWQALRSRMRMRISALLRNPASGRF